MPGDNLTVDIDLQKAIAMESGQRLLFERVVAQLVLATYPKFFNFF